MLLYNAPQAAGDQISIGGGAKVTLSAMPSGLYQGLSIFHDRNSTNQIVVQGKNTLLTITGSIYAASATLNVTTNADLNFTRSAFDSLPGIVVSDLVDSGGSTINVTM